MVELQDQFAEIREGLDWPDARPWVARLYIRGRNEAQPQFHHKHSHDIIRGFGGNTNCMKVYFAHNLRLFKEKIGTEGIALTKKSVSPAHLLLMDSWGTWSEDQPCFSNDQLLERFILNQLLWLKKKVAFVCSFRTNSKYDRRRRSFWKSQHSPCC